MAIPMKQTNNGIKYLKYFLFSSIRTAFLKGITLNSEDRWLTLALNNSIFPS